MIVEKLFFKDSSWNLESNTILQKENVQTVFVYIDISIKESIDALLEIYPHASIVVSSVNGNIIDTESSSYLGVATALCFENSYSFVVAKKIKQHDFLSDVKLAFDELREKYAKLQHVLVYLPPSVDITVLETFFNTVKEGVSASLVATSLGYDKSYIAVNDLEGENVFVCIGFYGSKLHVEVGCESGWYEFGPRRKITKSKNNTVYTIDNMKALELYKRYLGQEKEIILKEIKRFPLSIKKDIYDKNKTIRVSIESDFKEESLCFLGNIPQGSVIRLMKTNIHNILDAAFLAAKKIRPYNKKRSCAFVMSCYTRKNVLRQFAEEELEIIQDILTTNTQLVGGYSYGEFSKRAGEKKEITFQNQSIGLTVIYEE